MFLPYTKRGFHWENILIEDYINEFIVNIDGEPITENMLNDIPGGSIYIDMKLWGLPEQEEIGATTGLNFGT